MRLQMASTSGASHAITSVFILPHRDLAYQLLHWVQIMVSANSSTAPPSLDPVAQVLVRDQSRPLSEKIAALKDNPPHILLTTPNALMEVYEQAPEALQFSKVSTVVVGACIAISIDLAYFNATFQMRLITSLRALRENTARK